MSLNLDKGARVNLSKEQPNLALVGVGLGWDPIDKNATTTSGEKRKGIMGALGGLFNHTAEAVASAAKSDMDIDASCFMLDQNGKCVNYIYFGNKTDDQNGIKLSGDDLSGRGGVAGAGTTSGSDKETIIIDLRRVSAGIAKLDVWANIYSASSRNQHFGLVNNSFIRLYNRENNTEICKFNMSGVEFSGFTALKLGTLYRHDGEWKFNAAGEATFSKSLTDIKNTYN
jgi:stress response protein SCP2